MGDWELGLGWKEGKVRTVEARLEDHAANNSRVLDLSCVNLFPSVSDLILSLITCHMLQRQKLRVSADVATKDRQHVNHRVL